MGNDVRIKASVDDKVSGPLDKIRDKFDVLGKNKGAQAILQGVGMGAGISAVGMLGSALDKATAFMGDAINAASELSESQSKVQAVFGDSAGSIEKWADTASTAFGQSKQQALEAAGTYGNLLKAFGETDERASQMSKTLVELASDLASFNNTSVDDALLALRSGLSGETEPLKRYGIAISDARMRTELAAQGVKNLGATLTPLQKTQAAYALILKDSTLAQGDFKRTSDGLANTQRTLDAQMADLTAQIGDELLPVMLNLAHFAKDAVVPALRGVADNIELIGPAIQGIINGGTGIPLATAVIERETKKQEQAAEEAKQAIIDAAVQQAIAVGQSAEGMADDLRESRNLSRGATSGMATDIKGIGTAAQSAERRVGVSLDKIVDHFDQTRSEIESAASGAADSIYGPIIAKGHLAELERDRQEQRNIINSKKSTKAQVADAQLRLTEIAADELETRAKLAGFTGTLSKDSKKFLTDLQTKYHKATGEARADLDLLIKKLEALRLAALMANVPLSGIGSGDHVSGPGYSGTRASGGPVLPGKKYLIGEEGPEDLIMFPGGGGVVKPLGKKMPSLGGYRPPSSSGGAAPAAASMTFVYAPQFSTASQREAEQFARSLEPFISQQQVRRGIVVKR